MSAFVRMKKLTTSKLVIAVDGHGREGRGQVMPRELRAFPDNIRFSHADWVVEEISDDRRGYDLILAYASFTVACAPAVLVRR